MAIPMNIPAAKARLSEIVARTEAGEEAIIARDGKTVVTPTANRSPCFSGLILHGPTAQMS